MPESPDATELFALFNEIGIIEQLGRTRLEAHLPDGLIAPHFTVLNHLIRVGDGTTPLAMARAFQVPKTSLTHTLQGLERRGFIEMRPNPEDGRSKTVWITPAGRRLREGVIAGLGPELAELMTRIGADRLMSVHPVLTELRKVMDAARDPKPQKEQRPAGAVGIRS
jgi:DNA-binding MarR family transcriptional regulator